MSVSARYYGHFFTSAFTKLVNLQTDAVKVALFSSALTPDQDVDQFFDSAPYTANQITGTGYVAGGVTLSNVTLTYTPSTNTLAWDANDVSWGPNATFTGARYAIVYSSTPSNKPLIMFIDLGEDKSPDAGTLSIQWDAAGIGYVTVA